MHLSTHYYILSLSAGANNLYECFRDAVIDVQNGVFPVEPSAPTCGRGDDEGQLRDLLRNVDQKFREHYRQEQLGVVVLGESGVQAVFASVTEHKDAIIGHVDGDYTMTSPRDVGKIAWPVVKDAMSGFESEAMRGLEIAKGSKKVAFGIDAVSQWLGEAAGSTLLVEEDYHVVGSLLETDSKWVISADVDVRVAIDDVVDAITGRVLESGGKVFFLRSGSLKTVDRIALILVGTQQVG